MSNYSLQDRFNSIFRKGPDNWLTSNLFEDKEDFEALEKRKRDVDAFVKQNRAERTDAAVAKTQREIVPPEKTPTGKEKKGYKFKLSDVAPKQRPAAQAKLDQAKVDAFEQPLDEPDIDVHKFQEFIRDKRDEGIEKTEQGDPLGDELTGAAAGDSIEDLIRSIQKVETRDRRAADAQSGDVYTVTGGGALGSERGPQVERALSSRVLPEIFGDGRQFQQLGGSSIKTDLRDQSTGDGYTVKSAEGGVEASNAGFRRFFDHFEIDPQSKEGQGLIKYFGAPLDYAREQGYDDGLGQWNDRRDGRRETRSRQLPLQLMHPEIDDWDEAELGANAMLPQRIREQFPEEHEAMMNWLEARKKFILNRAMRERPNDRGESGIPDEHFDATPATRSAFYHLDRSSNQSPYLTGNLDIHDISDEAIDPLLEQAQWNLADNISGGFKLNVPNPNHTGRPGGRGSTVSMLDLTRKANKAGGGRYGNGFHSPRFGFSKNAFNAYPLHSSTPLSMTMGANTQEQIMTPTGNPSVDRQGNPRMRNVAGDIIPDSIEIGETTKGPAWDGK